MRRFTLYIRCCTTIAALGVGPALAAAQMDPTFTYQGQLKDEGVPVNGLVYLEFSVWDAPVEGMPIGDPYWTPDGVFVVDGFFTAEVYALDFGPEAFNGEPRWLQITVTDVMGMDPVVLSPRQPITPAPYALYALGGPGGGDSVWSAYGSDIFYMDGNVGIGEEYPWAPLTVVSQGGMEAAALYNWDDGTSVLLGGMSAAVEGNAQLRASPNSGVIGRTYHPDGVGVYGVNYSYDDGLCVGVWGRVSNPEGYAGLFEGRGYFTEDVGVGRIPSAKLDVAGTLKTDGFQLTDTPVSGYVLTCDAAGNGSWQPGGGGSGSSPWTPDAEGITYQAGNVGIGTGSEAFARLQVDSAGQQTIHAHNGNTSAQTFAVYAVGESTLARTIFGDATADTGQTVGVFGRSQSPLGYGVLGDANADSGTATGIWGRSQAPEGYGVWGSNESESVSPRPIGVYGSTTSTHGIGVKGYTDGTNGVGMWARAEGTSSHAILAEAPAELGTPIAVEAYVSSPDGYGIYSFNESEYGNAIAIYGESASPEGYAAYFEGNGYFGGHLGVGTTSPVSPLTVDGVIYSTAGGFKFPDGTVQTTAGGGGGSLWQQAGDEIYYDAGNVGVGVNNPHSTLHVAGGNWDVAGSEGDFKIGSLTYRLKMGVGTGGGEAGECRIFAGGPSSKLILGANGTEGLTVTGSEVDVSGNLKMDGFQLTGTAAPGYVLTCDEFGYGTWQAPTGGGGGGFDLPYDGTTAVNDPAFQVVNTHTGSATTNCAAHFESAGLQGRTLYASATGTYATGVKVEVSGSDAIALSAHATASTGRGIVAHGNYAAALLYGNVIIYEYGTQDKVIELGKGLDYAEGFDVTDSASVEPGTVLVIDSRNAGQLVSSTRAYDRRVAGIVAGAQGLGSGVRLGGDFDHDVALAGRVYCNVVAADGPIDIGDLLTTSDVPGHAMKVQDVGRAQGAILGKAMESLAAGNRGQILVLVTLQ